MQYDIMLTWSQDKAPGPSLFQKLRDVGAEDVLRNGSIRTGDQVYFTAYATINSPIPFAHDLQNFLYDKYDLDIVEVTWNPPNWMWAIANWCLAHNFRRCVDTHNRLIEWVSNQWLRSE